MISFWPSNCKHRGLKSRLSQPLGTVKYGLWNGALVSLVPPLGRSVRALCVPLVFVLLLVASAAAPALAQDANATDTNTTGTDAAGGGAASGGAGKFAIPGDAPTPAEGNIVRVLTIGVVEPDKAPTCADGQAAPCWDVSTLVANPGDVIVLNANLQNSAGTHNLHITTESPAAADSEGPKTKVAPNELHTLSIVMPAEGTLSYICDVHPQTMVGKIVTPAAAAAAGGGEASVPTMGVHFLAYWVGVIAFALLFIVYGMTFFLFKYNETNATTDHWDRSEAGSNPRLGGIASLLAVVIAVVAIGAVIWLATRR